MQRLMLRLSTLWTELRKARARKRWANGVLLARPEINPLDRNITS